MNRIFAFLALITWTTAPAFGATTYDVSFSGPADGYGPSDYSGTETVVGTITLVSGTKGPISASDVLSYSLSSVPGDPQTFAISGTGSGCLGLSDCGLSVIGKSLVTYSIPCVGSTCTYEGISFPQSNIAQTSSGLEISLWTTVPPNGGYQPDGFQIATPATGYLGDGYSLPVGSGIARRSTAPVPLPAAAWLFLSAIGGLGFFAARK